MAKTKVCRRCGIVYSGSGCGGLCQTCRKYERNGGVWHPLPGYGEVVYDAAGRAICHVCGMAMDKLIEHTRRKHGLDSADYRKKFGLMRKAKAARLTSPEYSAKMHGHNEDAPTWRANFADVHAGRVRGKRLVTKWTAQEAAVRHPSQVANARKRRCLQTQNQPKGERQ